MPSRSPITFNSCTAVAGNSTVAPAQTVAFDLVDGGFVGTLSIPAGSTMPVAGRTGEAVRPGPRPAHLSVVEARAAVAGASAATLRFRVVWMSPDLRAACKAA